MGEAISPWVRLFTMRVRLFQDITSPWAPVGAKKFKTRPKLTKAWEIIGTICILFLYGCHFGVLFHKLSNTNTQPSSDLDVSQNNSQALRLEFTQAGIKGDVVPVPGYPGPGLGVGDLASDLDLLILLDLDP